MAIRMSLSYDEKIGSINGYGMKMMDA